MVSDTRFVPQDSDCLRGKIDIDFEGEGAPRRSVDEHLTFCEEMSSHFAVHSVRDRLGAGDVLGWYFVPFTRCPAAPHIRDCRYEGF